MCELNNNRGVKAKINSINGRWEEKSKKKRRNQILGRKLKKKMKKRRV